MKLLWIVLIAFLIMLALSKALDRINKRQAAKFAAKMNPKLQENLELIAKVESTISDGEKDLEKIAIYEPTYAQEQMEEYQRMKARLSQLRADTICLQHKVNTY